MPVTKSFLLQTCTLNTAFASLFWSAGAFSDGLMMQALKRDGRRHVGLLGTKATLEFGFFQKHFATHGIETRMPESAQRAELDRIIWEELSRGRVLPASRAAAQTILRELEHHGVEAVILGCTELNMLIQEKDTSLPQYDTTQIHAEAILEFAVNGGTRERKKDKFSGHRMAPTERQV